MPNIMAPKLEVSLIGSVIPEIDGMPSWARKTQGIQLYATARWLKSAMDIWIPTAEKSAFFEYCDRLGVCCVEDVIFSNAWSELEIRNSVWGGNLNTTKTLAYPLDSGKLGEIHAFVSKDPEKALEAHRFWWYPAVCNGRVSYKSFHDTIEFWYRLGYPACCVNFFFEKNDWNHFNFPFEIFSRSTAFDYRCNPFWKDVWWSFIYHMPCSFSCQSTVEWVSGLESLLQENDPAFLTELRRRLQLPVLSLREQKVYAFEGVLNSEWLLRYEGFYRLWKPSDDDLSILLSRGNALEIVDGVLLIHASTETIRYVPKKNAGSMEIPFLISFT